MAKDRKESRQFNISVEGINCEKMYFEHLAKLINESGNNNLSVHFMLERKLDHLLPRATELPKECRKPRR